LPDGIDDDLGCVPLDEGTDDLDGVSQHFAWRLLGLSERCEVHAFE